MWLLLRALAALSRWLLRAALLVAAALVLLILIDQLWPDLLLRAFYAVVGELGE
jgi:hypothetical protein